ncbi:acetoacetyl-CoA synthetase [Chryseolinea serpens]|uniref:Acetoacetyl-CoA synthetase n=1 Tax=Chryseolinea serpens TaxID=947013 RepID=A0A1M5JFC2_9BACT|nr:acetoacetate--CoA ligase [Chryseolinea serpens]SHG38970.1 acetoacetyl-CoA synthetase [Chryseolinea serpens]
MKTPTPLWTPSQTVIDQANLTAFMRWLGNKKHMQVSHYSQLWEWSTTEPDQFWEHVWQYFDILHDGSYKTVTNGQPMPHTQWFEGTRLNYAEHVFRKATTKQPAIVFKGETGDVREVSWEELKGQVAALQHYLASRGVKAGDRVAAYLPCIPEASAAFLAASGLGATWSSCSPDFGTPAVIDRFAQIEPKVLIAVDHYRYGGKVFDKTTTIQELLQALPTVETVIVLAENNTAFIHPKVAIVHWTEVTRNTALPLVFQRVPFGHPLWVLYSSGTTGLPKAIVHSQGGILLEQLKYGAFHNDFLPGDRCFWYTTTGWMMWNYIHGSLLAGGVMVLYDGSPAFPDLNALWEFSAEVGIHHFGTSAGYLLANMKAGIAPARDFDLSQLRSISSTGSTLPPEGFAWVYKEVKPEIWLVSMSGGTDVCSAFVGGNPIWPVYAGEIQCRALGCALETFDEHGEAIKDEVGEMVITQAMPSMPIYFWNDPAFRRYTESYFETFPGVWRHGDWARITPRQGVVIYGRSDATLNRGGVRIGTSEIYRAVDKVKEVKDSLIICLEKEGGQFWMPLFVVMQDGTALSEAIKTKINTTLRNDYSPRHVPDEIIAVPDIPYTLSGKKTETPVKKILMGKNVKEVVNAGALKNPEAMEFFTRFVK